MLKKIGNMKIDRIIFLILLQLSFLFAQDVRIQASVSKNSVGVDEQFSYALEISGSSMNLPEVEYPEFKDFFVLSGPNTSTNMQWINGKMSSSKKNTFYLQPRAVGNFTISAASLEHKGKTYSSNTVTVKVQKSAQKTQADNRPKNRQDAQISGQDLFIKTLVSKRKAYLGEQITVTYKLYFRAQVRGYNFEKTPANAGFWTEEFQLPRQPVIESEVIKGLNYNTAILRKVAVFPTQMGKLTLEPMEVSLEAVVKAQRSRRSLFDSFFDDPFGRTVQKVIATKAITIDVLDLPTEGKPNNFSGAVGNFQFSIQTDKRAAEVNEAISLRMALRGSGNIKLARLPEISIPHDIEQYEPKVSSKVNKDGGTISGSKNAEIILIPRIPGAYQIKPASFSFFNPAQRKYQTILTKAIDLQIAKGSGGPTVPASSGSGLSRYEVTLLGQDIRFIKEFSNFTVIDYKPYLSVTFWAAILGLLGLFMVIVLIDDRQARISGDERLARNRRAGKLASRQLANAKKHLTSADQGTFYKLVSLALQGFVRDKLNIELTEFSAQSIGRVLNKRGIPDDEIKEYQSVLEESDFKQYAGSVSSMDERNDLFNRARNILTRLEKWI